MWTPEEIAAGLQDAGRILRWLFVLLLVGLLVLIGLTVYSAFHPYVALQTLAGAALIAAPARTQQAAARQYVPTGAFHCPRLADLVAELTARADARRDARTERVVLPLLAVVLTLAGLLT